MMESNRGKGDFVMPASWNKKQQRVLLKIQPAKVLESDINSRPPSRDFVTVAMVTTSL